MGGNGYRGLFSLVSLVGFVLLVIGMGRAPFVTLWAAVHLVANGDLASLILFGSFGAFSLFDMWSANQRGAQLSSKAVPYWRDLLVVVVGGVVFMGLLHSHAMLFGMPVSLGI